MLSSPLQYGRPTRQPQRVRAGCTRNHAGPVLGSELERRSKRRNVSLTPGGHTGTGLPGRGDGLDLPPPTLLCAGRVASSLNFPGHPPSRTGDLDTARLLGGPSVLTRWRMVPGGRPAERRLRGPSAHGRQAQLSPLGPGRSSCRQGKQDPVPDCCSALASLDPSPTPVLPRPLRPGGTRGAEPLLPLLCREDTGRGTPVPGGEHRVPHPPQNNPQRDTSNSKAASENKKPA